MSLVWFMVFNATFKNNSVISCRSVLLVKETGVRRVTTDLQEITDKLYHIMFVLIESTIVSIILIFF